MAATILRVLATVCVVAATATTTVVANPREHVSGDVAYTRVYFRRTLDCIAKALYETEVDSADEFQALQHNVSRLLDAGETNWKPHNEYLRAFAVWANKMEPRFASAYRNISRKDPWDYLKLSAQDPVSSWDYIYDLIKTVATNATREDLVEKLDKEDARLVDSAANDKFLASRRKVLQFVGNIQRELPELPKRALEITRARYNRLYAAITTKADEIVEHANTVAATGSDSSMTMDAAAGSGSAATPNNAPVSTPNKPKTSGAAAVTGVAVTTTTALVALATTGLF